MPHEHSLVDSTGVIIQPARNREIGENFPGGAAGSLINNFGKLGNTLIKKLMLSLVAFSEFTNLGHKR